MLFDEVAVKESSVSAEVVELDSDLTLAAEVALVVFDDSYEVV